MRKKDEKWSLFWCNLLHPLIFGEIEEGTENQFLKKLSEQEFLFPDGKRKKPSLTTLRRKLNLYRQGGFQALARKKRNDCGTTRSLCQEIRDKAVELKKEQPLRSEDTINRFLQTLYGTKIARSTLYRHLKEAGATKIKLGISQKKVRKRFSRDHTHDLWVGDFEEGPYVLVEGEVVPTYLSVFIDCHSRYVVEGRYYIRQNLDILLDSLLRAWAVHGKSKELYVDNAKIYHANALKSACYSLNINLLHRPPKDPAPGGLVERFFETCQSQFEAEVRAGDILTLNELNRFFSAYLAVAYHQRIHSETGQAPHQRYDQGLTVMRHVHMQKVLQFFMKKEYRTVDKDFSDIRLESSFYRVDPKFRGDRVEVRYDPFSDRKSVFIYSLGEEYLGQGSLYNRDKGIDPEQASRLPKPQNNYLALLKQEHEKMLQSQSTGIDYCKIRAERPWPFSAFVSHVATLMGRKGGLGAFSCQEYEMLKKTFNSRADLNESMVSEAWHRSEEKNLAHLLYHLNKKSKE
jgi:putative transposase